MQQREELGNDTLDRVGNKDLIAVELNLVLLNLEVVANLREIEDTRQIERIVDVQVDIEQRIVAHRIHLAVELLVLLLGDLRRLNSPQRLGVVDDVILVGIDILAVLPLLLFAKSDLDRQETAILAQQPLDLNRLGVLLAILRDVQNDVGAVATLLVGFGHSVFGRALAGPNDGLRAFTIRASANLHLVRYHKCRVETQTEVADNGLILVLRHKLLGTREGDLVDVLIDLLGCHTDTRVRYGQRASRLIDRNTNGQIAQLALELANRRERAQFLRCIYGIRNQLTQENLVIRIEKFFDDGENIFSCYPNFSVLHSSIIVFLTLFSVLNY